MSSFPNYIMKNFLFLLASLIFFVGNFAAAAEHLDIQTRHYTGNFPSNGIAIPFLTVSITPQENDTEIAFLDVLRTGLSANDDFDRVWAEAGWQRSRRASFNNDDVARLYFQPALFVPHNQTVEITIYANVEDFPVGRTAYFVLDHVAASSVGRVPESGLFPSSNGVLRSVPQFQYSVNPVVSRAYRPWYLICQPGGCYRAY
jgi:hypothetical protein